MDCSFCRFLKEKKFVHYEEELFWGMFDFNPVSPGHIIIIPKRHVENFDSLSEREWAQLQKTIKSVIKLIESTDLDQIYNEIINFNVSKNSVWFAKQALNNPNIHKKPAAYNHGVNDGIVAGRTVDHFHWHVIPRHEGDVEDPRGGVRYVLPELGNYKTSR
jgi:diadenosine tetraphosphate (Ap4A) HIT family hydrolase